MPVISVLGAKGGCGASLIATNLSIVLARNGSCLLVDLHPLFGCDDLLLNLAPTRSWLDLLPVARELTPGHLKKIEVSHPTGMRLLGAPNSSLGSQVSTSQIAFLLRSLATIVSWLVLDLPGSDGQITWNLATLCEVLLLVSTPDAPALRASRRLVRDFSPGSKPLLALVLNQIRRSHPADPATIADSLGIPLMAALPPDPRAVGYQISFGQPCIRDPRSPLGQGLIKLAQRLVAVSFTQRPSAGSAARDEHAAGEKSILEGKE